MTMLDTATADFGAILGLEPGDLSDRDHLAVDIDGIGQLHVERQQESLLVYLSRPIAVGADRLELYKLAMRLVHFENNLMSRAQCALHADKIIFLSRVDAYEISTQSLEATLELLIDLQDKIEAL